MEGRAISMQYSSKSTLREIGIPERKAKQFENAGIETVEQLASLYPKKYGDFRKHVSIKSIYEHVGNTVAIVGTVCNIRRGVEYVTATICDEDNCELNVTWFNQPYIYGVLRKGCKYVFLGLISQNYRNGEIGMSTPVYYSDDPMDFERIYPFYKSIKGVSYDYMRKTVEKAVGIILADSSYHDTIPQEILDYANAPSIKEFLVAVHQPHSSEDIKKAENRKIVDALYPFAVKMTERKMESVTESTFKTTSDQMMLDCINELPFALTDDQKSAVDSLAKQMSTGKRVNALVQGDVGCGKTAVAIILTALMVGNHFQVAVMAPTTVLAEQHYLEFDKYLRPLGINTVFLSSATKKAKKDAILKEIASGKANVVVGTHAVLSDAVQFNCLGLAIVDEEHRFGVEQRTHLKEKTQEGVHSISMTATPIPRTLALTLYGENIDVINIRTMPQGRKPIITVANSNESKVYEAMKRQIDQGHQCYVICPIIDESDNDVMAEVESVDETYHSLKKWFEKDTYIRIERVTGNLKPETIQSRLAAFAAGKVNILVSTTIVEVGVNVPNATVMVIRNAERFGLSQLHQLRGRVGRSQYQSYCVLLTKMKQSPRVTAMVNISDGFTIAQQDLALRGSGDVVGTKQHGIDRCVTLMLQHPEMYKKFCEYAEQRMISK